MMYRNLNERRFERKKDFHRKEFMQQLKSHHEYVETFVETKKTAENGKEQDKAKKELQKHKVEAEVRDMFIKNNYDISQFD